MKKFHDKFNELALATPVDGSLRAPNLQEVLAADKAVWTAVTTAIRENNWSLSDTMSEVAPGYANRAASPQGSAVASVYSQKPDAPGPGKKQRPATPIKKDAKLKEWNDSWVRKHNGKGISMRRNMSNCGSGDSCRFLHVCPVPIADGTACGKKDTAKAHQSSPH